MSTPNRLDARFAALKAANKKAFITFTTAGYPDLDNFKKILGQLPKAGVDIIEIGVPFSDPVADGPIIQQASIVALQGGITLAKVLDAVREFRKEDNETPIVLMGYYNPMYSYGIMKFLDDAGKAGIDAFIVPDLPPEEDAEFRLPAKDRDLHVVRLITPTTDANRLPTVLKDATGFLYCVSIAGITGSASADSGKLNDYVERIRMNTELPIAIGFGINTPQQAYEMSQAADGVIVGSAILRRMASQLEAGHEGDSFDVGEVIAFVAEMAEGAHR